MPSDESASSSTKPKPPRKNRFRIPLGKLLRVYGHSMSPVLNPGELVVVKDDTVNDWTPQKGQVVAVRPASFGGRAFIKRIAALPSERITVDGKEWQLSDGEFFLLGDHAEHSLDSRIFGPVTRDELIGPVQAHLWPWTVFDRSP